MQKGLRETDALVMGARKIMELNPFVRKETAAYAYAFSFAAKYIREQGEFNWEEAAKIPLPDNKDVELDYPATRTITIKDEDGELVIGSFKKSTGQQKIFFSDLLSICTAWTIKQMELERLETGYRMITKEHKTLPNIKDYSIEMASDKAKSIEEFKRLSTDDKLVEIYSLLLEIRDGGKRS